MTRKLYLPAVSYLPMFVNCDKQNRGLFSL